jgi:hypothetical protein
LHLHLIMGLKRIESANGMAVKSTEVVNASPKHKRSRLGGGDDDDADAKPLGLIDSASHGTHRLIDSASHGTTVSPSPRGCAQSTLSTLACSRTSAHGSGFAVVAAGAAAAACRIP